MDIEEAKRRAMRGPRLLLARRAVLVVVTFVSTITVARLVSPSQYGLASMSIVIISFAQVFRDFGVTNAVMRRPRVDYEELSIIFWFNVVSTTVLSTVLLALAPVASDYYNEPVVEWTIVFSVVGFQIGGLAMLHRALLHRELRFETVAVIDIVGALVGFVVTLVLAVIRHDVWAIVIGSVCQNVASALLAVVLERWRPGRPSYRSEFWSILKFGANSSVYAVSIFMSRNAGVVLIGGSLGSAALGQYNRAQALFNMPGTNLIQPIAQATMPLLTRLREHADEYKEAYLRLVRQLCVFLMPLSVTLCFAGVPLTQALLGDRWATAGVVFSALAPALAATGIAFSVSDVFITQDRSAELRNLGLVEVVLRIGSILVAIQFGLLATALAYTFSTVAVCLIRVVVAGRKGPVTVKDQLVAGAAGVAPAVGSAAACMWVSGYLPQANAAAAAVLIGMGMVGAFLAGLTTPYSRLGMIQVVELFAGRSVRFARWRRSRGHSDDLEDANRE